MEGMSHHYCTSDASSSTAARLSVWPATGVGVGLLVPAPGTIAGLWGLPLTWAVLRIPSLAWQLAAVAVLSLVAVWLCGLASRALGCEDPGAVALDEIVALPIVFLGLGEPNAAAWVAGFVLFRVMDIAKPPPIKWGERLPGGWGIVADDLLAAMFAALALRLLFFLANEVGGWGVFV